MKPLLPEEQIALCAQAQTGNLKARDLLIRTSIGLVRLRAHYWIRMARGLELEDLISYGTFGLFDAIRKFDPTRGAAFTSYAARWIDTHIRNALALDKELKRSDDRRRKYARQVQKLRDSGESLEIAVETVAQANEMKTSTVRGIYDAIYRPVMVSLNEPLSRQGDGDLELGDMIVSSVERVDDQLESEREQCAIRGVIDRVRRRLSPRDQLILDARILDDEATLREVGTQLRISFERVRQIEAGIREQLKIDLGCQKLVRRASSRHEAQTPEAHPRQLSSHPSPP